MLSLISRTSLAEGFGLIWSFLPDNLTVSRVGQGAVAGPLPPLRPRDRIDTAWDGTNGTVSRSNGNTARTAIVLRRSAMKITFPLSKYRFHDRHADPTRPHFPTGKMIAAGTLTALLLSGCSAGGSSSTSAAVGGGAPAAGGTRVNCAPEAKSGAVAPGAPADSVPLSNTGGSSSAPGDGFGFGTMTLSVPADKLDTALDQLGKIGTVIQRNTSSQDVTSQYVDTESRMKTMRASVDRVRALMAQAKDLGQVVALESEMSRREADLESLESQRAALKVSVDRSTLAVSLRTPGNETVTE